MKQPILETESRKHNKRGYGKMSVPKRGHDSVKPRGNAGFPNAEKLGINHRTNVTDDDVKSSNRSHAFNEFQLGAFGGL
jgi:hypothetical protein